MRHAIQYALTYPERRHSALPSLDIAGLKSLHFEEPDLERFPCISLAYRALREGGTMPAVMNAANEEAVHAFIDERIALSDIPSVIETVMEDHETLPAANLDAVLSADRTARKAALSIIQRLSREPVESSAA
jgi:1-deoxy-D-xylulose-5-phosphate reductoisomerase